MTTPAHSQQAVPFAARLSSSSPSPNSKDVPGQMSAGWSEDPSTPPDETHENTQWELSGFSMDGHLEAPAGGGGGGGGLLARPSPGAVNDLIPTEYEHSMSMGLCGSEPSLTGSFSSVESDGFGQSSRKNKNTRTVSNLTPEQLERKRSNDRRAQRAIRERTKRRMEDYQNVLSQRDEMIMALSRTVHALEEEIARLRGSTRQGHEADTKGSDTLGGSSDSYPRCPSLTSSIPGSHRGSLASDTTSPPSLPSLLSLPSLPSNNRSSPMALGGGITYGAVQELEASKMAGTAWPGGGSAMYGVSLDTGPSAAAMGHDGFAGSFFSSPPIVESSGIDAELPRPPPAHTLPTQRGQAYRVLVRDEDCEPWAPTDRSCWHAERESGNGGSLLGF
ncbi:uncharacterized protein DNG_02362 [Cephalotrichum gorgonifer]|uniref:BZIP domain-containing protein n=1 Tax=Cephalotrichum gorgonifer TaxID=2041049 RepID=A0AAE8MTC5_9PEZI|nr:uncharacterized protein DNG_02362 [Cephalotrichum gorgonifer]